MRRKQRRKASRRRARENPCRLFFSKAALKTKGFVCTKSSWLRQQLILGVHCHYCDKNINRKTATIDHWIPIAKGGVDCPENWRACCEPCNRLKGDIMPETFINNLDNGEYDGR